MLHTRRISAYSDLCLEPQEGEWRAARLPSAIYLNQIMKGKRYWVMVVTCVSCEYKFQDARSIQAKAFLML